jgi:prepilin-type N-terminal cleavage/methylation domain-containing protein
MKHSTNRAGFTLVEVLLAVSISVMVFAAMGVLLGKCFSLWKDATAHWRLAQVARISRERILCGVVPYAFGGITNLTGLLSATNVVLSMDSGWQTLAYQREGESAVFYTVRGWPGTADDKDIQLRKDVSPWVYGQSSGSAVPDVKVDSFAVSTSNDLITISYRLKLTAAGQTFTQPQTISASLVNEE